MKILHTLIFVLIAACAVFAQNDSLLQKESVADSSQIYEQLIKQENTEASSSGDNVVGMVWGGVFTVTGGVFFGTGLYYFLNYYNKKSLNSIAGRAGGALTMIASAPFLLIGIPVLSYNIYKYNERRGHANKRDEYQRSLDDYKLRQGTSSSVKMTILPSLDFINGGGLNLLTQF